MNQNHDSLISDSEQTFENEIESSDNPFLHGTTSETLALMAKSDYSLHPILMLLEKYLLAPPTGELNKGGLSHISARGNISFGRLCNRPKSNEYHLESLIEKYAIYQGQLSQSQALGELQEELWGGPSKLFDNLNLILIRAARYRQLGGELLNIKLLQETQLHIKSCMGLFYLYLILGKYLEPQNANHASNLIYDAFYTHLNADSLIKAITAADLDLASIYHNPTAENLQQVVTLLELPKTSIIKVGASSKPQEITLIDTQFFRVREPDEFIKSEKGTDALEHKHMQYITQNASTYTPDYLLFHYLKGEHLPADFIALEKDLLEHIELIENRSQLLNRMLHTPFETDPFNDSEQAFLNHPFPVIFIYNQEKHMEIFSSAHQEYRSSHPLVLGVDILKVATDKSSHKEQLEAYFREEKLSVEVVLFAELFKERNELLPLKTVEPVVEKEAPPQPTFLLENSLFKPTKEAVLMEQTAPLKQLTSLQSWKIYRLIEDLESEVQSCWPYFNKDRKIEKITALNELLDETKRQDVLAVIKQIEKKYPHIRKGVLSTRTADLLDEIYNENLDYATLHQGYT